MLESAVPSIGAVTTFDRTPGFSLNWGKRAGMSVALGRMGGMEALLDTLREVVERTRGVVRGGLGDGADPALRGR